ncbi:MAG: hypothetical protein JWN98_190 [Abditibacteriota bacterium]|nr:hypothetical protein [Abditibacteriota bacterium]
MKRLHTPFHEALRKVPARRAARVRRSGQALIGLLAVTLILFGLYFLFLGPRRDESGATQPSVARQSIDRGHETAGTNYIGQIQLVIQQYRDDNEGRAPASLEELKRYAKFPPEMWLDPVTQQPLVYDPQTGTVSAPSAGSATQSTSGTTGAPGAPVPPGVSVPNVQPQMPAGSESD